MVETQICKQCKRSLPLEQYYIRKKRKSQARFSRCIECDKGASLDRWKALSLEKRRTRGKTTLANMKLNNPKVYQERQWRACIRSKGLHDQMDYILNLLRTQTACAICKTPKEQEKLNIDHCHATGKFRGLLCSQCNIGLGCFKDNPSSMIAACEYLNNQL